MKRQTVLVAFAFVFGASLVAAATWHCLGWMTERHMTQSTLTKSATWPSMLKLTAEQRARIAPLENNLRKELAPIETELAMRQMLVCRLMMAAGALNREQINQELEAVSHLEYRKEEKTVDHLATLRSILTPDQQKALFTTLMTDICRGCRALTGGKQDYCGLCKMR